MGGSWRMLMSLGLVAAFLVCSLGISPAAGDAQRVDKDTLKAWLGRPDVLVIDVRQPRDWDASSLKIQGAVRQEPGKAAAWAPTLPRDKTLVLYCA